MYILTLSVVWRTVIKDIFRTYDADSPSEELVKRSLWRFKWFTVVWWTTLTWNGLISTVLKIMERLALCVIAVQIWCQHQLQSWHISPLIYRRHNANTHYGFYLLMCTHSSQTHIYMCSVWYQGKTCRVILWKPNPNRKLINQSLKIIKFSPIIVALAFQIAFPLADIILISIKYWVT